VGNVFSVDWILCTTDDACSGSRRNSDSSSTLPAHHIKDETILSRDPLYMDGFGSSRRMALSPAAVLSTAVLYAKTFDRYN
jgi:hypothetical protein